MADSPGLLELIRRALQNAPNNDEAEAKQRYSSAMAPVWDPDARAFDRQRHETFVNDTPYRGKDTQQSAEALDRRSDGLSRGSVLEAPQSADGQELLRRLLNRRLQSTLEDYNNEVSNYPRK